MDQVPLRLCSADSKEPGRFDHGSRGWVSWLSVPMTHGRSTSERSHVPWLLCGQGRAWARRAARLSLPSPGLPAGLGSSQSPHSGPGCAVKTATRPTAGGGRARKSAGQGIGRGRVLRGAACGRTEQAPRPRTWPETGSVALSTARRRPTGRNCRTRAASHDKAPRCQASRPGPADD